MSARVEVAKVSVVSEYTMDTAVRMTATRRVTRGRLQATRTSRRRSRPVLDVDGKTTLRRR
jgi:hypothetical protein